MVPVPAFTVDGLLPPGRHAATVAEIEATFVKPFASTSRRKLFDGWLARRAALIALLPVTEWVNGSFVEATHGPGDIDVVTFLPAHEVERLNAEALDDLGSLFDRPHCREAYGSMCTAWVSTATDIRATRATRTRDTTGTGSGGIAETGARRVTL